MPFKLIVAITLAAVASAQYIQHTVPVQHVVSPVLHAAPIHAVYKHNDNPAKYDFSYSVHDTSTGDIKEQHEVRDGDNVQGSYSLVDADGLHRIVDYTADEINGFQATVRREGQPSHKIVSAPVHHVVAPVSKVISPVHYAHAPVVYQHSAPVVYQHSSPLTHVVSAPVSHVVSSPVKYAQNAAHVSFNTIGSNYHY